MSLIVNPSAAVNWTLLRERICDKGMEKAGRLGAGEVASPEDRSLCIEALDSILKNLAVHGYKFPKTSPTTYAATFLAGVQANTLPADYYNLINMTYLDASGNEVPLWPATTREWNDVINKTSNGGETLVAYIDNFNVLHVWPKPTLAITVNVYYQQVIQDSSASNPVDLDSPWMLALPYGIAVETAEEFELSDAKIKRLTAKWTYERSMLIAHESQNPVNQVSVDD